MRNALPENLLRSGDSLGRSAVMSLPVSSMDGRIFAMIIESMEKGQNLRISYRSPYGDGPPKTRVVSPWGVFFQSHAWYMWGSHDDLPKGATYRISRMKKVIYSPETTFIKKPEDRDIGDHAASGWYGYTGNQDYPVVIVIDPPLSEIVRETLWHPSQEFFDLPNGSVEMRATVPDIGAVARWIMASAPYASAVSPDELVERVRELSEKMEERHRYVERQVP
jgi:predicted DNA-binding transcriptional regulator YafY